MPLKSWIERLRSEIDRHRRKRAQGARRARWQQLDFQPALSRLEDRRVLSVSVGVDAGVVTFQGDEASDSLSLGINSEGHLQYRCDGEEMWTTDLDSGDSVVELRIEDIAKVQFFGGDGDDTLTVAFGQMSPIPAGGIQFGGADGTDALRIIGNGMHAAYTPDATVFGSGLLTIGSGAISFASLEPIDYDVGGGSFTLNLPGGDDAVDIAESTLTVGLTPALQISGTSGGSAFENARVRGSVIALDTTSVAGIDTITVAGANNLHTNTSLLIRTGGEAGDVVTVNGTSTFSGTVTLDSPAVLLNAPITNTVRGTATTVSVASPGQIQDGIDVAAPGGTVKVAAGSYAGGLVLAKQVNFSPGASPSQVVIDGNLTLNAGDTLTMELASLSPLTEYDNFVVNGNVVLNGAILNASRETSFVPPNGASFTLIDNDGSDAVAGEFGGLAEGATVILSGIPFTISYHGGSGNDVVLTIVTPTEVYVDDSWAGTPIGTTPATSDPAGLIFQYNAFAEIQGGIDGVATGGTVTVYGGRYSDPVALNKVLQPIGIASNPNTPAETLVDIAAATTLHTDIVFQQLDTTSLTFSAPIDATTGAEDLTVNGPNTVTFAGIVGGSKTLARITTDAGGTTRIDTSTINAAVLDFHDVVLVATDAKLIAVTSVDFSETINSEPGELNDLTIASSQTTFRAAVGNLQPLNSLTTDADGTTDLNGGFVATVRDQTYNDAVVLTADTVLKGNDLTFQGTVNGDGNGPRDLTLDAGAGDVTFGDDVGTTEGLDELRMVKAHDVTARSSVRTASLIQESGSGTTAFHGAMTVTGPSGIDVTTGSLIFNDRVSTLDANGPLTVNAAQQIALHALVETGVGPVELAAGGDVSMSRTGRITTAGAQVNITADRRLQMSDGARVETVAGTIRVSADKGIAVGRIVSETLVTLNSVGGAIQDAGDSGGADIESPSLALRAAGGIGSGDSLETRVQTIAIGNTDSGGVQIANDGPLTIGAVDGLAGVTNRGGGDLAIVNNGSILAGDPVLNAGGGDTALTAIDGSLTIAAPIRNDVAGNTAGGSITLKADDDVVTQQNVTTNGGQPSGSNANRGVILFDAGGSIQLDPGVTIATGTGQMTAAPAPEDMPPPVDVRLVPVDQGGSDVDSMGHAFVDVTVGDVGQNYQITIDWSNGAATYPPGASVGNQTRFMGRQTYRFDRYYTSNPDPTNAAAPIPVQVTIAYDGRSQASQPLNGIVFKEGGQALVTTVSGVLTVPGTGLFAVIKVIKSEIVPVALRQTTGTVPIVSSAASGRQQTSSYEAPAPELEFAARTAMRLFFRRVDASGQEGEDVELPPELLERGLSEVFHRFPNGRYRIYLKEPNSDRERLIQEVNVYQGRIVPPDFRDSADERQMEGESEKPAEQRPTDEPMREHGDAQSLPAAKAAVRQAEGRSGAGASVQPAATAAAAGGAAIVLGMTGNGSSPQWADQVDRAFQAGRRTLSKAARLSRRLRRKSEKDEG